MIDSPDGEFARSMEAVHAMYSVNSNFSYYDKDAVSGSAAPGYQVNLNNKMLWDVS